MGLSFLYPAFLIAGLAVAVPIVLHLLRRRTELVVEFPAVRLLHKAPLEQRRRRRLRELILLVLRVAALLLLTLAFARPYLNGTGLALSAPVTVVAVDTSMSLSAPGQIDSAREAARAAIGDAAATDATAVITFADSATVVAPPTLDRSNAYAAIAAIAPGPGGTRYRTALARAAEVIGTRGGRVVVVTDLQQAGWEASDEGALPDGIALDVVDVGGPAGNLAVTSIWREEGGIAATVHNYGSSPVETRARLRVDGQEIGSVPVKAAAHAAADVRFDTRLPETGAADVTVDDEAGYQADNVRYLVLDPPSPVPLAIVTADPAGVRSGLYVQRALETANGRGFGIEVVDGRKLGAWPEAKMAEQAAIVVLGTHTLERDGRDRIRAYLEQGGHVLLTLGPDVDVDTLRDIVGVDLGVVPDPVVVEGAAATLVASDVRHPIFRPFLSPSGALGDVSIEQYRQLRERDARRVLARFSGGAPALVEQSVGAGRLLVFTSDLDNQWNRFPLNASFVPFALETAQYLSQGREAADAYVLPDVPRGVPPVPAVAVLPDASNDAESKVRRVAVNVDVRESNPARVSMEQFTSSVPRRAPPSTAEVTVEAREQEDRQHLWQIGLVVMLLALAGEGLVGRKAV